MHIVLAIAVGLRSHVSKVFNEGIWLAKIALIVGLGFAVMYLLPDSLIYGIQVVSAYLVPMWYLLQVRPPVCRV